MLQLCKIIKEKLPMNICHNLFLNFNHNLIIFFKPFFYIFYHFTHFAIFFKPFFYIHILCVITIHIYGYYINKFYTNNATIIIYYTPFTTHNYMLIIPFNTLYIIFYSLYIGFLNDTISNFEGVTFNIIEYISINLSP